MQAFSSLASSVNCAFSGFTRLKTALFIPAYNKRLMTHFGAINLFLFIPYSRVYGFMPVPPVVMGIKKAAQWRLGLVFFFSLTWDTWHHRCRWSVQGRLFQLHRNWKGCCCSTPLQSTVWQGLRRWWSKPSPNILRNLSFWYIFCIYSILLQRNT